MRPAAAPSFVPAAPTFVPASTSFVLARASFVLAAVFVLASCEPGRPLDLYIPEPIVDSDPMSRLVAALRRHNRAVLRQEAKETLDRTHEELLLQADGLLAVKESLPPDLSQDLLRFRDEVALAPHDYHPPQPLLWTAARAFVSSRSTVYLMYGYAPPEKPDRESIHFESLEYLWNLRGYRLVKDYCTSADEWRGYLTRRDAAALVWRGHGWLSLCEEAVWELQPADQMATPLNADIDSTTVSRVWSGDCSGQSRRRLFANTWDDVLPEGLSFLTVASCGSAGPFSADQVNTLVEMGDPEDLLYSTFQTELNDRVLAVWANRGYLVTQSYRLTGFGLRAAALFLPSRTHMAPHLAARGQLGLMDMLCRSARSSKEALMALRFVPPLDFIYLLIQALYDKSCFTDDGPIRTALSQLAFRITGQQVDLSSAGQWEAFFDLPETRAASRDFEQIEILAPSEADLWVRLVADFSRTLSYYRGEIRRGTDQKEYCWERWLRCILTRLSSWRIDAHPPDDLTLVRQTGEEGSSSCGGPLPEIFRVFYHVPSRTYTHNLKELVELTGDETVMEHCVPSE